MIQLPKYKAETLAAIDALTAVDVTAAQDFVTLLLRQSSEQARDVPASSAALAACICRFLLHRRMKTGIVAALRENETLRRALFGQLNSYKYSLCFLLRRVIRADDTALLAELLTLLAQNPFRDDSAADYAKRWSMDFLLRETLRAPAEYLQISEKSRLLIKEFSKTENILK